MDENYTEWGYRADGVEVWQDDNGRDGSWIPARRDLGVGLVDIYEGDEAARIQRALAAAGVAGEVIRRTVTITRGDTEVVAVPDSVARTSADIGPI